MSNRPPFDSEMAMRQLRTVDEMVRSAQNAILDNPKMTLEVVLATGGIVAGDWVEDDRRVGVAVFADHDGTVSTTRLDATRIVGIRTKGNETTFEDVRREPVPPARRDATIAACLLQAALRTDRAPTIKDLGAAGVNFDFAVTTDATDPNEAIETIRGIDAEAMLMAAAAALEEPSRSKGEMLAWMTWPEVTHTLVNGIGRTAFDGKFADRTRGEFLTTDGQGAGVDLRPSADEMAELASRLRVALAAIEMRRTYRPFMIRDKLAGQAQGEITR